MNVARFQNENVDVFQLVSRFQIHNVPKSAICSSARTSFDQKMLRYELGNRYEVAKNEFFFFFEKLPTTEAKN